MNTLAVFKRSLYACILMLSSAGSAWAQQPGTLMLWYRQPARTWTEALPLGNGRIGAMDFGGAASETLQLNEATLWSGGPVESAVNPEAYQHLDSVRTLLFEGHFREAAAMDRHMQGLYSESYEPMGYLDIRQHSPDTTVGAFRRSLDLATALSSTRYTLAGVRYQRDVFVSAPAQLLVVRIRSAQAGSLNLDVSTRSLLRYQHQVIHGVYLLNGQAPAHVDPSYHEHPVPIVWTDSSGCRGMRFALALQARHQGGKMWVDSSGIHLQGGTELLVLLAARTSFNGFDRCPVSQGRPDQALALKDLAKSSSAGYNELRQAQKADFCRYFDRVSLHLGQQATAQTLPTDERLERYAAGAPDPGLEAQYFQFGRYLMIAASRTPDVPTNLQGIWNDRIQPPWSSNYTININTEMNYWPSEECALPEMHRPLFGLLSELAQTGRHTAWDFYHAPGWVAHHNTDIWAMSYPVGDMGSGDPVWANWPMGGNWLSRQLFDHFLFSGDTGFLRQEYPILRGAAEFSLHWLVRDSAGFWVTAPSMSPENSFRLPTGGSADVSVASTMDLSILRGLFNDEIRASRILGLDQAFRDTLRSREQELFPFQIGRRGNLQEWSRDWISTDVHHRHISHVYGLFPGREILPWRDTLLAEGIKRALELRGDLSTGWSLAWKINCWARLLDGNHAYRLVRDLLHLTHADGFAYHEGGGTLPNLFCAHPPFQIDGNFGGTAGIAEMLLQSQGDALFVLPALPDAWSKGDLRGLLARGGFQVRDLSWDKGHILRLVLYSSLGGNCRIRSYDRLRLESPAGALSRSHGPNPNPYYLTMAVPRPLNHADTTLASLALKPMFSYDLPTKAGGTYVLVAQ